MKHHVYIALGSNIGDRQAHLHRAIGLLQEEDRIQVIQQSSIYETEPIGYTDQQSFLNMVIRIQTACSPSELLEITQAIEQRCGRTREIKWGPRTIDLDILLYDQENMEMENLIIPHPRMWERAFVIVPLMELEPELVNDEGKSIQEVYRHLDDRAGVKKWKVQ